MSGSLVSPGVQVQLSNQSFYGASGPGTVPFIMMATASNKSQPGSSVAIAPGTIKANADKLYLVTSQRELLQTFGNPNFYTQAGTPQNGNELNEYGLYAAYQYLGIANSAYVMRADIDLASLAPTSVAPVGLPSNGDFWLDLTNTNWGIFRSNGNSNSSLAWGAVSPLVIDTAAGLERFVEAVAPTQITDPNAVVSLSGTSISICGVSVAYPATTTLNSIANAISTNLVLQQMGVRSEVIQQEQIVSGMAMPVFNLRVITSNIDLNIFFASTVDADLTTLGFATNSEAPGYVGNMIAPLSSTGVLGDIAVNAVSYLTPITTGSEPVQTMIQGVEFFEKMAVVTDNTVTLRWYPIGSTEWMTSQPTVLMGTTATTSVAGTITVSTGSNGSVSATVNHGDSLSVVVASLNTAMASFNALASTYTVGSRTMLKITNYDGTDINLADSNSGATLASVGFTAGTTYGNTLTYQGYTNTAPQPDNSVTNGVQTSGNIWINTNAGNRGAMISLKRYNISTATWIAQQVPLYGPSGIMSSDTVAQNAYGALINVNSMYAGFNADGTISAPSSTIQLKIWNGTSWELAGANHAYTQSKTTPVGPPAAGTLWYNPSLRVDIMVGNGEIWQGYHNAYPATDPNGAILSGSEPSYQSDNITPLANNDLWVDTSDLENYPQIYRWDGVNLLWNLIDNTDQISSSGVVFGDARQDDGAVNPSTLSSAMTSSNLVDGDAPSALSYPAGILLFNTRYSTYNVKSWQPAYLPNPLWTSVSPASVPKMVGRWVTASGNQQNGAPYMGRKAQRVMVTNAMAAAITNSQELRSETNFYNLIATPGYTEMLNDMILLNTDVQNVAFVICDAPARLTPDGTAIQNWATNANNATVNGDVGLVSSSEYAGVYYPWGLASNIDGTNIFVPPSTAALVTYAFNDQIAYPWYPPAGFNRGLVSVLSSAGYISTAGKYVPVSLNQGQRDALYSNKINPIAYIPGRGLVIYGQITLDPSGSAMSRVNVSRLINYLNYKLNQLAKPFLFELNDETTRQSVTTTFNGFMSDLVNLRGVYDFAVQCNSTNNTSSTIALNQLWIAVAIKPEIAIEFIYIPLVIVNQSQSLTSASSTTA